MADSATRQYVEQLAPCEHQEVLGNSLLEHLCALANPGEDSITACSVWAALQPLEQPYLYLWSSEAQL